MISTAAPPHAPLGELTALPQTPWLDLRGLLLREERGEGRKERQGRGGDLLLRRGEWTGGRKGEGRVSPQT